jgi:hypothetical protein
VLLLMLLCHPHQQAQAALVTFAAVIPGQVDKSPIQDLASWDNTRDAKGFYCRTANNPRGFVCAMASTDQHISRFVDGVHAPPPRDERRPNQRNLITQQVQEMLDCRKFMIDVSVNRMRGGCNALRSVGCDTCGFLS